MASLTLIIFLKPSPLLILNQFSTKQIIISNIIQTSMMNADIAKQSDHTFTTHPLEIPQFETTTRLYGSSIPKIFPNSKRQFASTAHPSPNFPPRDKFHLQNQDLQVLQCVRQTIRSSISRPQNPSQKNPKQNSDPNQHSLIKSPPNQMKSSFQKRTKDDSQRTQIDPNNQIEGKRHSNTESKMESKKHRSREIERKKQETKGDSFDNRTLPLAEAMTTTQSRIDRPAGRSRIQAIVRIGSDRR